jgi:predicted nucleic acid-binding protein
MRLTAFIDTNVPIYASGREHVNKEPCARVLMMAAEHPLSFVTDAEVFQELMYYYLASERWALGRQVLRDFSEVMHDRIEPVYVKDILSASRQTRHHPGISARDLVHATVMQRLRTHLVISTDTDFDRLPNITRLDPARVGEWGDSMLSSEGRWGKLCEGT